MKEKEIKYVIIFIGIIIVAILLIIIYNLKKEVDISSNDEKHWIEKRVYYNTNTERKMGTEMKWEEKSISEKFNEFKYCECKYMSRNTKIQNDYIGTNIGISVVEGYDSYTERYYTKNAYLYSIKDLSEKCIIAVKFEGDTDYYVYSNLDYKPKTLGNLINDLHLEEIASFETINYNYWDEKTKETINIEFYNVDNRMIWQKLFSNFDLENVYNENDIGKYTSERFSQDINISVNIPLLGYKNISILLTDKGYLMTSILDTDKVFYIGKEKVQEFLDYIKKNYDGYKLIYVNEYNEEIVNTLKEKTNNDSKIITTENKNL